MNKKKVIVYIGNFHFPDGNAAGKRVLGVAKLFILLGYRVVIIDTRKGEIKDNKLITYNGRECNDGIISYSMPYSDSPGDWFRITNLQSEVLSILDKFKSDELKAVIFYGSPRISYFNKKIITYLNKRGVDSIADVVDWLTVKTKNPILDLVKSIDDTYQKKIVNCYCKKVICISTYIEEIYKKKCLPTLLLPPIMDEMSGVEHKNTSENRTLFYAGNPFRSDMKTNDVASLKDRIDLIINGLASLKKDGVCNFIFNIYGFTKSELLTRLPSLYESVEFLGRNVSIHGKVSNSDLLKKLSEADYTVLFRDSKRDSLAGFPSKVAESIANHTPVIVTDIGDIYLYLSEGKHAFFSRPEDYQSQKESLKRAILLSEPSLSKMKFACSKVKCFNPKSYLLTMNSFLDG